MKKLFLAMAAAGICVTAVNAEHIGDDVMLPAVPPTVNVIIPQYQGSWLLAIEGKYQQQVNGDFHYAATADSQINNPVINVTRTLRKIQTVSPEHSWGVAFELGYQFAGNGRDVRLSWMHLHDSESENIRYDDESLHGVGFNYTNLTNDITARIDSEAVDGTWDKSHANSRNDYDHVDLVFAQSMDFAQKVNLRTFAGLRYADIDLRDKVQYRFEGDVGSGTDTSISQDLGDIRIKSDFQGLGPRAGIDAKLYLGSGISIVGTIAGSLLVGSSNQILLTELRNISLNSSVTGGEFELHKVSGKHRVVPELDSRLGISYMHDFTSEFDFVFEVGYEVINYFDVKDDSLISYVDTMGHGNDFALRGLYLKGQFEMA